MRTIFPEDGIIEHPNRSILTIYTSPLHFSFSVHNPEERGSFFYKELNNEKQSDIFSVFKEMFFEHAFFSLPFRKVRILNRTPTCVFVPSSIYKDKYREDFINFLSSDQQGITMNSSVSSAGIMVLYHLPEAIYHFMLRSFPKPEFIHYSAPLITYFLNESKKTKVCQMVVNLQEKGLDIFCFSKKTFLLGNYFPFKDLQEALYYILFTWKQLNLDQLNDCLYITGHNVFKKKLIGKLTPYLQQIHPLTIPPAFHFEGIETGWIPFELAILSLCE